jgi:hypothetical protein
MTTDAPSVLQLDVVPGVFHGRASAERAIEELRALGLQETEIGVALAPAGTYQLAEGSSSETLRAVLTGAAAGLPLGSLAGVALAAFALPAVGAVGLGGMLMALPGGALWGAVVGGYSGMALKLRTDSGSDTWCTVPLEGGDVLVTASGGARREQIREIMLRQGARCFLDQAREIPDAAGLHRRAE